MRPCTPHPHKSWHLEWLDLLQVLCRQPHLVRVTDWSGPAMSRRHRLKAFLSIFWLFLPSLLQSLSRTLSSHWFSALWPIVVLGNYLQKCSLFLAIRELQTTITKRFDLTPVRMARIKMTNDNRCCEGCRGKGNIYRLLLGVKTVSPPWKSMWGNFKEINSLKVKNKCLWPSHTIPEHLCKGLCILQRHILSS